MIKLNPNERGDLVTKGFLEDYLDDYFDEKLEPYVTKDYLDKKLKEQSSEFRQYIDTMIGYQIHQIQIFMEQMDERYVLRKEWIASQ